MLSGLTQKGRGGTKLSALALRDQPTSPVHTESLTQRVTDAELGKPVVFPQGKGTRKGT